MSNKMPYFTLLGKPVVQKKVQQKSKKIKGIKFAGMRNSNSLVMQKFQDSRLLLNKCKTVRLKKKTKKNSLITPLFTAGSARVFHNKFRGLRSLLIFKRKLVVQQSQGFGFWKLLSSRRLGEFKIPGTVLTTLPEKNKNSFYFYKRNYARKEVLTWRKKYKRVRFFKKQDKKCKKASLWIKRLGFNKYKKLHKTRVIYKPRRFKKRLKRRLNRAASKVLKKFLGVNIISRYRKRFRLSVPGKVFYRALSPTMRAYSKRGSLKKFFSKKWKYRNFNNTMLRWSMIKQQMRKFSLHSPSIRFNFEASRSSQLTKKTNFLLHKLQTQYNSIKKKKTNNFDTIFFFFQFQPKISLAVYKTFVYMEMLVYSVLMSTQLLKYLFLIREACFYRLVLINKQYVTNPFQSTSIYDTISIYNKLNYYFYYQQFQKYFYAAPLKRFFNCYIRTSFLFHQTNKWLLSSNLKNNIPEHLIFDYPNILLYTKPFRRITAFFFNSDVFEDFKSKRKKKRKGRLVHTTVKPYRWARKKWKNKRKFPRSRNIHFGLLKVKLFEYANFF